MTRQLFLAITLISTTVLLTSPASALQWLRCEDRNANCIGFCHNLTGGAGDFRGYQNRCMARCDRQVNRCLINAYLRLGYGY